MAGMYPYNETIELFGEAVSWPGVDASGKFTNGSFSDPLVRPSFIPAETVNLILDNLSALLVSLNKIPNNQSPDQLASALSGALALKASLASPVFTGTPKVPSKTAAATSDGTLIATEAQVKTVADSNALKAPIASPALTGTPTAPTAAAKSNSTQIATTAYADRAGHPVGSFYTQYPVAGQSTLAGMFPSSGSPATLFGGTWTERFAGEEIFFKTAPAAIETNRGKTYNTSTQLWSGTGTVGIQEDAIRNITGAAQWAGMGYISTGNAADGSLSIGAALSNIWTVMDGNLAYSNQGSVRFDASKNVPTDTANHPKNRLIKVWERTA